MILPNTYLLLVQPPGSPARVEFYRDQYEWAHKPAVLFSGGRVAAKKFLRDKDVEIGWENVPQYVQKKGRGGKPGPVVRIEYSDRMKLVDWKAGQLG